MNAPTRLALEQLYSILLSAVVVLARVLDKPCPITTRKERRAMIDRQWYTEDSSHG